MPQKLPEDMFQNMTSLFSTTSSALSSDTLTTLNMHINDNR